MTISVARLIRYPIKSVGREDIETVSLTAGQTMPWDRTWAVRHEDGHADNSAWAACRNFLRVAYSPALAAVKTVLDTERQIVSLSHPNRPDLQVSPDQDSAALLDWLRPIVAANRSAPAGIVRVENRGMTDTPFPSISIANMSSHRAVSQKVGHDLSLYRWRSNIWLEGLAPWQEFEWEEHMLRIGTAELKVVCPIQRCMNVQANPETGNRDVDVLAGLKTWSHQDFSMAAEVTRSGTVSVGDKVELI